MKKETKIMNRTAPDFPVKKIRDDFPILKMLVHGKPLTYLDNAATTQKPQSVIDAVQKYYSYENSNVHRGVHYLSELATQKYEEARLKVKKFINAASEREIIFVRGTTEAINLVASCYGKNFSAGDEVLITGLEHHSNIVPWQMICKEKGAKLRVVPIDDSGNVDLVEYKRLLTDKIRIAAINHVSNVLGTINQAKQMIETAHRHGVPVLIDGAQAVPHMAIDVKELDADFYAFSSHKVFGPTGIGVLYGKEKFLESIPPYQGGGDMIKSVTFEETIFNDLPYKFEAGTPHIAGAIGLAAAIDYINSMDRKIMQEYEAFLMNYFTEALAGIDGLKIIGTAEKKAGVISFVLEGVHPHDIGTILDGEGIAIRTGHHCAQPVMDRFGIPATARVSFAFYNTKDEADIMVQGIRKVKEIFGHA